MKTLWFMVLRAFVPTFLVAVTFFVLMLQLIDLFANIVAYLEQEVPLGEILRVQALYLPKSLSFSLPVGLLFSVSFTLGTFYSNNELIAVFGAGVPLWRFVLPFVLAGLVLSLFSFWFEDSVVIDTLRRKNELSRSLLNRTVSFSNRNVTILSGSRRVVYHAANYNDVNRTLNDLLVLERDDNGRFLRRIDAEWAVWQNGAWRLNQVRVFAFDEEGESLLEEEHSSLVDPRLNEPPRSFRRTVRDVEEMRIAEAREWIRGLETSGLPFRAPLTDFYERFSFAFTPLVVALIASGVGGRFKKNILLYSLLIALGLSVAYYVTQMISGILAGLGYIAPALGAWLGVGLFAAAGILLLRHART